MANADTAAAKSALERAEAKPAPAAPAAPASTAAAPTAEPATPTPGQQEEVASLRQALAKLKKEMKTRAHGEKTVKRKLEHNRRAYMVTMMQLDLANDELCLIKTGKPRRQTALVRSQTPGVVPEPGAEEPETVEELLEEAPAEAEAVIDLTQDASEESEAVAEVVEEAPAEVVEEAPAKEVAEVVEEAPAEEAEDTPAEEEIY